MPIPLSELFAGCLLPAALSLGLWLFGATLLRSTKSTWIQDWILPLSLGIGFLPGYALLGLAPWQAESHWHYWVYALLWVALVSPLVQRLPSNIVVRWLATAALFVPVAWILTPKWELDFTKWLYVPLVIVLMTGLAMSLGRKQFSDLESEDERKHSGLSEAVVLCFSLFALVVMTFLSGSLRFTQLAMIGASCFGGLVWFRGFREHLPASAPWAATVIVGMLYIAQVNSYSSIPRLTYLLVALAPILGDLAAQVASMKHQSRVFLAVSSVLLLVAISWSTIVEVLANLGNEY